MGGGGSKFHGSYQRSNEYTHTPYGTAQHTANPVNYVQPGTTERLQKKYSKIGDNYSSLSQVTEALAHAGLESSNLIVGIDFTKSNEWTGKISFNRKGLHDIGDTPNPYEQAISIIGRTLSSFDEDNLIPCFGFGDASTHDQEIFSFYPDGRPCDGFEEALRRYREIVPNLRLAGPTSFAPIIETAIGIVDSTGGQYHVLLIIADGQVTRSVDTQHGQLSPQERATIDAIVKASNYPLSIVLVGVGDGPWDIMREFDDNIPSRAFDNFQFVNFTEIMSKNVPINRKETDFSLSALMEIPAQYKATLELQLLGCRRGTPLRVCLPPPTRSRDSAYSYPRYSRENSFDQGAGNHVSVYSSPRYSIASSFDKGTGINRSKSAVTSESSLEDKLVCPICLSQHKDLAFGCGHQTCYNCGKDLQLCPLCKRVVSTRIRLY
ncbi:E3 ubiquitin-protein ligase RGLG2 isoform X1 [Dendrobium catenatum]|uniref:E3 ubiquitin-protein ligase RGLG2 isoform X1 n=1 Tax=Dendrobium catenatum TaxID=906689 RepID=UPI0009F4EA89|nr:E3 ubiquitin-protein ligase RGLG2 isoform X1 [Dendrobium catenatum]XP_020684883.1 E3 ubiquitin-protein ligase RGLG2 isoform X1 [Dendrobium catenatum]